MRRPYTTGEAAPTLRVSRETARARAASEQIPAERSLGGWLLDPDAVNEMAAGRNRPVSHAAPGGHATPGRQARP